MFRFSMAIGCCASFFSSYAQSPSDSVVIDRSARNPPKSILKISFQSPLNTDRPSLSDNSYVLPSGGFQHEMGFQINFIQNTPSPNSPTQYTGMLPFNSFRLGIYKRLELRLATALVRDPQNNQTPYGISDLEIGFKYQIKENIAWITHVGIPNGTDGYSIGTQYLSNKISGTLPLGKTSLVSNIGMTIFKNPTTQLNQRNWLSTLVIAHNINPQTFVFSEAFLQYQVSGSGLDRNLFQAPGFDFGVAYKMSPNTQIDLSYGYIKNQPFINLGFSWGAFKTQIRRIRPLITPEF